MPAALWGQAAVLEAHGKRFVKVPRANDKGLLEDLPVGFTLRPTDVVHAGGKQPPSTVSRTVTAEKPAGNVRPPRVPLATGRDRERDRAKCIVGGGVRRSSSAGAGKRRLRHRGDADRQCREHGGRCAERPDHAGVLGNSVPGSGFHRRTWGPSSLQQGASAITSGSSPT